MNGRGFVKKLLRQPPSTSANEHADSIAPESARLRPSASQHTVFSTGAPITCLARSPDGSRVVVAGAKIFKVLKVQGAKVTEELDLRAIIVAYAASHDPSAATPEQLNIRDVQWSYGDLDTYIITACGNGRITVYDLNRAHEGLEVARIQEHTRQVHKLDISPFRSHWLLSASQDGTVRSFDLKQVYQGRSGPMVKPWKVFKCNADAVRDVKWSPTDGTEFACCTDAGVIQKWDFRDYQRATAPVLKLTAHTSACSSISWHPDGETLISGGVDQLCHVWDLSKKAERNQKPKFTFATPAPISRVTWRPACWSATAQGRRAAQVTIAYDDFNSGRFQTSSVHIWDLARSTLPFKEIEEWDSAPTGLVWNTRDLMWSVDKDGHFIQTDVAFVPQLIDRRGLSTFAFAPTGFLMMFMEERQAPFRPRPSIASPDSSPGFDHTGSGPLLSVSRSESEEDVVGSFLGPRKGKGHRRRHSGRVQSLSVTPPTSTGLADRKIMSLEDAVRITGVYEPIQVKAFGRLPEPIMKARPPVYQFISNCYLQLLDKSLFPDLHARPMDFRVPKIIKCYAEYAEGVGQYRLAQSWRVLAFLMHRLLADRAEYHRRERLKTKVQLSSDQQAETFPSGSKAQTDRGDQGQDTPRRSPRQQPPQETPLHRHGISIIHEDLESTSNVATPLARPVRDHSVDQTRPTRHVSSKVDDDELKLPEAAHPRIPSPIPVACTRISPDHSSSNIEGHDSYGTEQPLSATDYVAPPRKVPLRLDYHQQTQERPRLQPQRHDSEESFQMFSTSCDSHASKFLGSDSDVQSVNKGDGRDLRERMSTWENRRDSNLKHRPSVDSDVLTQGSSPGHLTPGSQDLRRGTRSDLPYNPTEPPLFRLHEASAPKVDETTPVKNQYRAEEVPISPLTSKPASARHSEDPNIIESDFYPWLGDPLFLIEPMDPNHIVPSFLEFELQTGVLNAAAIVLLLRPLLAPDAIDSIQAEAIMRQYHHRLMSMKLFQEAAMLRNLCVPLYPCVFSPAQQNVTLGFFCTDCDKPVENDPLIAGSMWKCPRCRKYMDPCPICLSRAAPDSDDDFECEEEPVVEGGSSAISNWWYCPGCGHGGHGMCMSAWHADEGSARSGGCCPVEGCLHPCLPGEWRDTRAAEKRAAKAREMDLAVRENAWQGRSGAGGSRGGALVIRRDGIEAKQSEAVEGVRVALGALGLERTKSARLLVPREDANPDRERERERGVDNAK
ncbi:hypothetical protein LZ554_008504 [Drepanopeziza brunnea f. sp. 'monogermtubi']|nr:hypothetical protein LZ554_008504 [Drepanopeziza brunnea f. sp. 'monogermtubi']